VLTGATFHTSYSHGPIATGRPGTAEAQSVTGGSWPAAGRDREEVARVPMRQHRIRRPMDSWATDVRHRQASGQWLNLTAAYRAYSDNRRE
jgi:hypothetical protein